MIIGTSIMCRKCVLSASYSVTGIHDCGIQIRVMVLKSNLWFHFWKCNNVFGSGYRTLMTWNRTATQSPTSASSTAVGEVSSFLQIYGKSTTYNSSSHHARRPWWLSMFCYCWCWQVKTSLPSSPFSRLISE